MGQYQVIRQANKERKITYLKSQRTAQLYNMIWCDIAAILKILLPSDKAFEVSNHLKSIMYSLIELKTGKRPDKI